MSEFAKTVNECVHHKQGEPPAIAAGVYHPVIELSLARLREFLRQPEALSWTFGFPVLLTLALGIAFRNTGPENIFVGVENSGAASAALARTLGAAPGMKVSLVSPENTAQQLRSGKITLVVKLDPQAQSRIAMTLRVRKAAPPAWPLTTPSSAHAGALIYSLRVMKKSPNQARAMSISWCLGYWDST